MTQNWNVVRYDSTQHSASISRTRGIEFFLLPSRVHARPSATDRERKSLRALVYNLGKQNDYLRGLNKLFEWQRKYLQ